MSAGLLLSLWGRHRSQEVLVGQHRLACPWRGGMGAGSQVGRERVRVEATGREVSVKIHQVKLSRLHKPSLF